jgi:hypothetical protein
MFLHYRPVRRVCFKVSSDRMTFDPIQIHNLPAHRNVRLLQLHVLRSLAQQIAVCGDYVRGIQVRRRIERPLSESSGTATSLAEEQFKQGNAPSALRDDFCTGTPLVICHLRSI